MLVTIQPSKLSGTLQAPVSKSSMQRACAAALIRKGISFIHNPGKSNDDIAAIGVIRQLGAHADFIESNVLKINSSGVLARSPEINCGESGLGIRMFTPLAALGHHQITIKGEGSLLQRPMDFFDEILPQLGVDVVSNEGKLPLEIKGPLQPTDIEIDGSLSSQFLTGLLMAYAAVDAKYVSIKVNGLTSKPYIDLTLKVMRDFGLKVPENRNYEEFYFTASTFNSLSSIINPIDYTIEGDWSGAAFLLVAGAVAGQIVVIKGLDMDSTQADKAVLQVLMDCGCILSVQEKQIEIQPATLKAFHFRATDCPDLFPPLVALACYCEGLSVIEGVSRLRHKESNRALTLQEEFAKMGVEIELQDDLMLIRGYTGVKGGKVLSHHDHRIAMACAVAALKAERETIIEDAGAVNKSYPDFFEHLQRLGVNLTINQSI
jgi:3-phosphoshikimate 1-carboxyvinyltransferase